MKKPFVYKNKDAYITVDWKNPKDTQKYLIHRKRLKERLKAQVARAKAELAFWQAEQKFWEEI